MNEVIHQAANSFGIPGIIIFVFIMIIKLNPITLLSSSSLELKLSMKEKRFSIKAIRVFIEMFSYVIFMLMLIQYFSKDSRFSPSLAMVLSIIILVFIIYIIIQDLQQKTIIDVLKNSSIYKKIILLLIFLIIFIGYFSVPSYYIGTTVYFEMYNNSLINEEKIGIFIAVLLLCIFYISGTYFTVIKATYRYLGFQKNSEKNLTITVENEKWFLFHPIESELFLLGDKAVINECTKFSFIEKKELLKKELKYEQPIQ